MDDPARCSHQAGSSPSAAAEGICPACLLELGLGEVPDAGSQDGDASAVTTQRLAAASGRISMGMVLGGRYRIESRLGTGAMGEVWRACDLKLQVEVALKALPSRLNADAKRREMLRREVRSAREVLSANVCRIYDLVEADGQELISMEYIDGVTLSEHLRREGPLDVRDASEIAMQLLAGLEAIHQAGFVHRDIKPDNVMITRSGRVVTMDFGIARAMTEGAGGTVAGTPAYMAPEQRRGEQPDPRWDLFAAGIVLAEMLVGPEGTRALLRDVRAEPPRLPAGPWRAVLERAVARNAGERYPSARSLSQALEDITLRITAAEDRRPYPGLASFRQADAEFFFGRESQVEEVWKKLRRPRLLGLIGPSGAGKSSFVRAGLLPALPEGWCAALCTPGARPLVALAQALAPQLAHDGEAVAQLVRFEEPDVAVDIVGRWKGDRPGALILIDQFEELFTLSPPDVQAAFAQLLGRLVLEADVHLLLSLRDDFLIHCQGQPALSPLFADLTALLPPTGSALRRALVQPALKCGYRFEDDELVDEMLAEVRRERGALPLLAFAVSCLWERRDGEGGLLTRDAYEEIGGVAGALAGHAERTLEALGTARRPLVRELFRNLVTAHGTRSVRDWNELLEVFEDAAEADAVLRHLVDARLLTSYEELGDAGSGSQRRVEIIHESLLSAWPRLVRWRTQDEDGAQLRDQLRMAAGLWEDRQRPDDLLWTGTSLREYLLWRERYPGGLSAREESFARAMIRRADRKRRRRRLGLVGAFATLLGVLTTVAFLWWNSEMAGRRAEARQLSAYGQRKAEKNPSLALAYLLASLERADDARVRRLALEVLWRGPIAMVLSPEQSRMQAFSPDGRWLATGHWGSVQRVSRGGGAMARLDRGAEASTALFPLVMEFAGPDVLFSATGLGPGVNFWHVHLWDIAGGELLRTIEVGRPLHPRLVDGRIIALAPPAASGERSLLRAWPVDGGEPADLGTLPEVARRRTGFLDPTASWIAHPGRDRLSVVVFPTGGGEDAQPRTVGVHDSRVTWLAWAPDGASLASVDEAGEVRLWSPLTKPGEALRRLVGPDEAAGLVFDQEGDRIVSLARDGTAALWDLTGPPDAEPLVLRAGASAWASPLFGAGFGPAGQWLAVGHTEMGGVVWPVGGRHPYVLRGHRGQVLGLEFLPGGEALISTSQDGTACEWPLTPQSRVARRTVLRSGTANLWNLDVDPAGRRLLVSSVGGTVLLLDRDTGGADILARRGKEYGPVAFGPDGRLAAMTSAHDEGGAGTHIRIVNVETGETVRTLDAGDSRNNGTIEFTPDGRLLAGGGRVDGIRLWDVGKATYETIAEGAHGPFDLSRDGRRLLAARVVGPGRHELDLHDLETGAIRRLPSGDGVLRDVAFDASGELVVTADAGGIVRVGSVAGDEPHLLLGHEGGVTKVAVSADGRWVASAGVDRTIRVWPVPTGPPLHTLPRPNLLRRLASLTNIRIVEDPGSPEGFRHETLPFPGWRAPPAGYP